MSHSFGLLWCRCCAHSGGEAGYEHQSPTTADFLENTTKILDEVEIFTEFEYNPGIEWDEK